MMNQKQIRQRLSEAIRKSGLSQKEIANLLKISQQTVHQYISGRSFPSLDTFANLCEVLDADPAYILGLR